MILRSALLQTLLGLAIGVPVAFYGVTLVKSQLYEANDGEQQCVSGGCGDTAGGGLRGGSNSGAAGGVSGSGAGAKVRIMTWVEICSWFPTSSKVSFGKTMRFHPVLPSK